MPPSLPFHSLQPLHRSHLALLQTSGIRILHTEAIADLEVREMNSSLSRTFLHSTFHFKFNFCHLFHFLLSKKGDCIDTGHLCIWRRKKKLSSAVIDNSPRELYFRYQSQVWFWAGRRLEFLLLHTGLLQFWLLTLQLHFQKGFKSIYLNPHNKHSKNVFFQLTTISFLKLLKAPCWHQLWGIPDSG